MALLSKHLMFKSALLSSTVAAFSLASVPALASQSSGSNRTAQDIQEDLIDTARACAYAQDPDDIALLQERYARGYDELREKRAVRDDLQQQLNEGEPGLDVEQTRATIKRITSAINSVPRPTALECGITDPDRLPPRDGGPPKGFIADLFEMEISFVGTELSQPSLGEEAIGAAAPDLDLLEAQTSAAELIIDGKASFGVGDDRAVSIELGYAESSADALLDLFDPAADARLVAPGPTGGASGFSVGDSAAFSNTASDLAIRAEVERFRLATSSSALDISGARVSAGIEFEAADFEFSLDGRVPGFDGEFRYETEIDQRNYTVFLDVDYAFALSENTSASVRPVIVARGRAQAGLSDLRGTDSLDFGFFNRGTTGGGTTDLDEQEFAFWGRVETGVRFEIDNDLYLEILGRANLRQNPEIVRDGNNPTRVELEDNLDFGAAILLGIPF